ncbi:hypothetical protein [Sphingomonas sp. BK235]|uniref:hypothetical protein n=1 Tax=Sphingomonas sp. BK235 TaxID=2512131 RepID=UPI0010DE8D4E|nr:hypothetical protein [Sphingomonas sp. BK235]TCP32675.1 hypothetical protein EV292_10713 [Sphingomonas sp. BK235]
MKHFAVFALASAAALPGAALAQAAAPAQAPATGAATVATGATVYDTSGGVVGTVESTDGTNAVVNTGTVKAAIPLTSLGKGAQGPVLAMTKAQLEAAAGQQQAQASADFKSKLVPGATVYGSGGTQLGTIKSVDASGVTLTTTDGDAVLPATGFGPGPQGVMLGMTAAQLKSAMTAAGGGSAAGSSAAGAGTAGAAAAGATTTDATAGTAAAGATTADTTTATPGTTADASTTAPGATTTTTKSKRKPR